MGDIHNMCDIERFMRSSEGKAHLEKIRKILLGHTIRNVTFENEVNVISTTLYLDDGKTFVVFQLSMEVDAIRKQFEEVIEREYLLDFPERKS